MQELSVTSNSRRLEVVVWGALILTIVAIAGAFTYQRFRPPAPPLPVISQVGDFVLTNQHGKAMSAADLRGHVWIANIIFTRCAGPCPRMTEAMKQLQGSTDDRVRLVTLTTDPDNDTPEVLRRYGEKFGADFKRWSFVTGSKEQIGRLAIDGLKLVAQEKPAGERENPADLFIHSAAFVIVDQSGNLRGAFQLDDQDLASKVGFATRTLLKR